MNDTVKKLENIGLVPVVKIDDASKSEALAKALIDGGLPCAEITFRTAAAAEAIERISKKYPDMIVGAGTVINVEFAKKAIAAGAKFIVSPGFNPSVVDFCIENNVPVVPGVCTPSDIEMALGRGLSVLKFFPAEASGGVSMLKALSGPFPNVKFMPTGGISEKNLADYIKLKNVFAVGGSWMVKADLIENEKWDEITSICKKAICAVHGFSLAHVGFNHETTDEAEKTSSLLDIFGFATRDAKTSIFKGEVFELMKMPYYGKNGHIGIRCYNVNRSLAYLENFGFHAVKEAMEEKNGRCTFAYLDKEIAGFAFHLVE